jgi:hypothetical protein
MHMMCVLRYLCVCMMVRRRNDEKPCPAFCPILSSVFLGASVGFPFRCPICRTRFSSNSGLPGRKNIEETCRSLLSDMRLVGVALAMQAYCMLDRPES